MIEAMIFTMLLGVSHILGYVMGVRNERILQKSKKHD
jgi:hypothetical protein